MGKQTSRRFVFVTVMARLLRVAVLLALVAVRPAALREARAQSGVLHVDRGATGAGDGTSWGDAFTDLQAALEAAVPGDEVWVATGVYEAIQVSEGVSYYGGFAGGETDLAERDLVSSPTVIDAADQADPPARHAL